MTALAKKRGAVRICSEGPLPALGVGAGFLGQSNFAVAAKVGKVPQSRHQKPPPSAGSSMVISTLRKLELSLVRERALLPLCTFQLFLMDQPIR